MVTLLLVILLTLSPGGESESVKHGSHDLTILPSCPQEDDCMMQYYQGYWWLWSYQEESWYLVSQ